MNKQAFTNEELSTLETTLINLISGNYPGLHKYYIRNSVKIDIDMLLEQLKAGRVQFTDKVIDILSLSHTYFSDDKN